MSYMERRAGSIIYAAEQLRTLIATSSPETLKRVLELIEQGELPSYDEWLAQESKASVIELIKQGLKQCQN